MIAHTITLSLAMGVHRLNHAVLDVRDVDRATEFYGEVLGFRVVTLGELERLAHVPAHVLTNEDIGARASVRPLDLPAEIERFGDGELGGVGISTPQPTTSSTRESGVIV